MLRRGPSRRLVAFLASEDLDALLSARTALGEIGDRDRKAVVTIIGEWSEPQAVSNLLFYPDLIPEDVRMPCLLRALDEEEVPYYRLAAIVGLQEEPFMSASERADVADRLLQAIEDASEALREWEPVEGATTFDEVVAARASSSLPGYVTTEHAGRLAAQLDHPSETVQENVLWTLVDLVGRDEAERLVEEAIATGTLDEAARQFVADQPDPMMLWAYIPNLRDLFRAEESDLRRMGE